LGLLFERGNPAAVMAPDLLVSFGAGGHARSSYKLWQEPVPDLVMELLSPKTWRRDVEAKPGLYEELGVREFWLFDPIGKLPRPVNGWRLDADVYAPMPSLPDGGYRSTVLNLDLVADGDGFRFRDPATGELLPDHAETATALRVSETARRQAESARRVAEARVAELEALLRRSDHP
ncbi:MAG: Uma2 family endonuclease, partial [Gammaproteobacteria bacterium]|nr:Uma2 family endonuclease [Gammaproteobacteria bacterium]